MTGFSKRVISWQKKFGRHDLPWQIDPSPYKTFLSEIMLQQTQVETVKPYFEKFLKKFSTVKKLAGAHEDSILSLWSGLGYYRRAINLHRSAKIIQEKHDGMIPNNLDDLLTLPGIGPSTAGAILSLGYDKYGVITDGNVKRLYSRYYQISGDLEKAPYKKKFLDLAKLNMPKTNFSIYSQGVMDLGATVCMKSAPKCLECPLRNDCLSFKFNTVSKFPIKIKKLRSHKTKKYYGLVLKKKGSSECYLEKRDRDSFWPGRYCIPLFKSGRALTTFLENDFKGYKKLKNMNTDVQTFKFSHFLLEISLDYYYVESDDQHFYSREDINRLGIPNKLKQTIMGL